MQAHGRLIRILITLAVLAGARPAQAQIRLNVPEDIQPPIYAVFDRGFMPHTDEWAVVIFYRTPACVPADFNLLDFLDFSGTPASCALQIRGWSHWVSLSDPYPAESLSIGTGAVPLWFVRWSELQAAVADDVLTVGELASLPSTLVGSASFFHESVRNDIRGQRGGNEALVASGTLADGRTFMFEMTEKFRDGVHLYPHIRIEFR